MLRAKGPLRNHEILSGNGEQASKQETNKRKEFSLVRLQKSHHQFLETLRETQPLTTMTSFSIIIAAFSVSKPIAQQYAIAAGFLFLAAFLFSSVVSFGMTGLFEIYSYITTGLGMIFLGLVLWEYTITTQAFSSALGAANDIVLAILLGIGLAPIYIRDLLVQRREKSRSRRWYLSLTFNLYGTGFAMFTFAYFLWQASAKLLTQSLPPPTSIPLNLSAVTIGFLVGKILSKYDKRLEAFLRRIRPQKKDMSSIL